jgi:hypothetical protein
MERAVMLAKIQQQLQEKGKSKYKKGSTTQKYLNTTASKVEHKQQSSISPYTKERQKRDYCKANLCFYCMEHFDSNHLAKCTKRPRAQVNALALNSLDVPLTEEVLEQLEIEDSLTNEFCSLSLNAIKGTEDGEALKLRALVRNKVMLILVDSGSSHSFVSTTFLQTCGIKPSAMSPTVVKVANGDTMISDKQVPGMEWWIQGHTLQTDMKVLDLAAFYAILGYDWLKCHSPMNCHWGNMTLAFQDAGRSIELQGVLPVKPTLAEISSDTILKWCSGNEVGAFAILEVSPQPPLPPIPAAVQPLLEEYKDVFEDPKTLPPPRHQDHHIPLLPNSAHVNSRPYRYSPLQKDEIERQVKELLAVGLITPNNSPFASPVLLVQKRMALAFLH